MYQWQKSCQLAHSELLLNIKDIRTTRYINTLTPNKGHFWHINYSKKKVSSGYWNNFDLIISLSLDLASAINSNLNGWEIISF